MRVRDIMTPEVHTLPSHARVTDAAELMRAAQCRHVPVLDHGNVAGMVSYGDVRKAELSSVSGHLVAFERRQHLAHATVEQIMHHPVHVTTPDALVQEVAGLMRRLKVGCLPVVEDGRVVGIVTEIDILRVMEHLPSDRLPPADVAAPH